MKNTNPRSSIFSLLCSKLSLSAVTLCSLLSLSALSSAVTAPRGTAAPPSHSLFFSELLDLFVCWLFLELHSERGTASTVDMRHHYRELSAPPRSSSGEILGFEFKYCLLNNLVLDFRFEFKYCLLFQGGFGIQGGKNSHVRGNLSSAIRYLFPFPIQIFLISILVKLVATRLQIFSLCIFFELTMA